MNQTRIGEPWPILQRYERDYDPIRGFLYREHWEGINQVFMEGLQQDYINSGVACRLVYELGKGILEVNDSTQEYVLDFWEIPNNDEVFDPFLNPNIVAEINTTASPDATIAAIRAGLDAQTPAYTPATMSGPATGVFATAPCNAIQQGLPNGTGIPSSVFGFTQRTYQNVMLGLTGYKDAADGLGYVLRHSTNVSNKTTVNIADFGTGQIYSVAQLLSEVSDNGLWINPCPEPFQYLIANIAPPIPRPNWQIGWFKDRSTRSTAANNRINIQTEYVYGQFSSDLYNPYQG
jgi:hypothetical protein